MENKTNSKTFQENLIDSGNTLKETLKGLTSIKNSNTNSIEENNENQSSISSIIKSPSLKSISELPASSIKQASNKISETTSSFFNITSISLFLLVVIVLGIFGYIIYDYLVEGSEVISNLFNNISDFFSQFTENNNKKNSKEIEKNDEKTNEKTDKIIKNIENKKTNNLKSLESSVKNKKSKSIVETENSKNLIENEENDEPEPIRTNSLTSGFCYIGKVNDTRYCTKVDARSKCMSGDIYPTMEVCVNPNLRT
tara:strand:+ start:1043 stop:1807 length:765 start_codon:yes stop_codon:yes gene_type:complete